MAPQRAAGIRERNRAALTAEILASARRQLATEGAAGLSLRAVARELGLASSAIYRYFPSRDDLLTQLIIEAYDSLADAAERAERRIPRRDRPNRFRAIGRAIRTWALDHEHEYALIYGTPVPGYRAPEDTIPPATRVTRLLVELIREAVSDGSDEFDGYPPLAPSVRRAIAPAQAAFDDPSTSVPEELVVRGLLVWAALFGAVSLELFGQFHNVVATERQRRNPVFEATLDRLLGWLDL